MSRPTRGPWAVNKYGSIGAGEFACKPIITQIEPFYGLGKIYGSDSANRALIVASCNAVQCLAEHLGRDPVELAEGLDLVKLAECIKFAFHEFNAIRARDGAPQHIDWGKHGPMQNDSCAHEYWDEMTEKLDAALAMLRGEK